MCSARPYVLGLGLALCAGAVPAADNFILNRITTVADVEQAERKSAPGSVMTLVAQDIDSGIDVDSYATLTDRHTAYQSYSGFNAVRVGVVSVNGLPENQFSASTRYSVQVTSGPENDGYGYALFLDYLVFPGAVGLSNFAPAGSRAGYSFSIDVPAYTGLYPAVGEHGEVRIEKTATGAISRTLDPIFVAAGTQNGSVDLDGFVIPTQETLPFFDTAYLGTYGALEVVEFEYLMSAFVSIPGYEVGGWASLGDPFALRGDANAEIANAFPAGAPPFRIRMELVASIPEPGTWLLVAIGLGLLGIFAGRRRSPRAIHRGSSR